MYGTCCSCISFWKSIVSHARANGLVSTNVLSDDDKRTGSFLLSNDDVSVNELNFKCGLCERLFSVGNESSNDDDDDDDESSLLFAPINISEISLSTLGTGRCLKSLSDEDRSAVDGEYDTDADG